MKGYPVWPSKIVQHPDPEVREKNATKGRHFVYYFGSKNYSWISKERIYPNSDDFIAQAKEKKLNLLHKAVEEFISEVKVKEYYNRGIVKKCQILVKRLNLETLEKDDVPQRKIQKLIAPVTENVSIDTLLPSTSPKIHRCSLDQSPSLRNEGEDKFPLSEKSLSVSDNPGTESVLIDMDSPVTSSKKVGFICEGELGTAFLEYVRTKGHETTSAEGIGLSAAEFLAAHDIIVCCVDNKKEVESIFRGEKGIFQSLNFNGGTGKSVIMICSLQLPMSEEIIEAFETSGGMYLEARFYGSQFSNLEDGLLLVTGDKLAFQEFAVLLSGGDKIKYIGSETVDGLEFIIFVELFFKLYKESHPGFNSMAPEPEELKYREVLALMIKHTYTFSVLRNTNDVYNKGFVRYLVRSIHM
ncbi:oxidoreductase GLYR1 [Trichonephila clavata]|uniref:Oxidoreductase GLYR1 n=1 Tax=Trichonephila clavata TaxID=2740835 RepID=A0A8X6FVJ1_TRICU|nr:oxidoreductase GLYR1 [Trichonephila clavata]